jgi:PAS domain-containing protein
MAELNLPKDAVETIRRRLHIIATDGVGYYIGAVLMFAAAASLLRVTVARIEPRREAAEQLQSLLEREQEPLRDDRRPVLSALVLGDISRWTVCEKDEQAAKFGEQLASVFELHYRDPTLSIGESASYATLATVDPSGEWARPVPDALSHDAHRYAWPIAGMERIPPPMPCLDPPLHEVPRDSQGFPSSVRIPSLDARLFDPGTATLRATDALERSRVLDVFERVVGRSVGNTTIADIYFISADGMLRTIPKMPRSLDPVRTYVGASYVWGATGGYAAGAHCAGRHRYDTRAYIDVLGNGIVSTSCFPIGAAARGPARLPSMCPEGDTNTAVGVLCIDYQLPRALVQKTLATAKLYDIDLVSVSEPAASTASKARVCGDDDFPECSEKDLRIQDGAMRDRLRTLGIMWRDQVLRENENTNGKSRGDSEARKLSDREFGLPVWRDPASGNVDLAIVTLSESVWDSRSTGYAVGCAFAVCVAIGLLSIANVVRARRRKLVLLSSIQSGVMRVDSGDVVVEANDRAQELLHVRLPRFGSLPTDEIPSRAFADLIDIRHMLQSNDEHGFEFTDLATISRDRAAGRSTSYYARVQFRNEYSWLRFIGSPLRSPAGVIEAYGVVESVGRDRKRRLDEALERLSPKRIGDLDGHD